MGTASVRVQTGGIGMSWSGRLFLFGLAALLLAAPGPSLAETHDEGTHESGGHEGGHGGAGGSSHDGDEGHEGGSGGHDDGGGHDGSEGGKGPGPQAGGQGGNGQGAGASGAGRPVWAQEGIPEVELGRLNVARSPERVLDRAFAEALAGFTAETAAFYRLDLAAMEERLSQDWDAVRFIDSPLQNLALLRDALDGTSILSEAGITTDIGTLQAVFLGTASDKTIPITTDTALAISTILGQPLSAAEAAALAAEAERIRQAILEGHG